MVVLKSKLSGYYFEDFGVWTSNPVEAMRFANEWLARGFARREHLDDVQVIEAEAGLAELDAAA